MHIRISRFLIAPLDGWMYILGKVYAMCMSLFPAIASYRISSMRTEHENVSDAGLSALVVQVMDTPVLHTGAWTGKTSTY